MILLQALCLTFFFSKNYFQRSILISSSNKVIGNTYEQKAKLTHYLNLVEENEKLAQENARLKSSLISSYYLSVRNTDTIIDTALQQQYRYYNARVINSTVNLQNNFLTLDKGSVQGISDTMGVISPQGLVGVVIKTGKNFSTVLPVINTAYLTPVEVNRTNNFGLLKWDGVNPRYAKIEDIANHARIKKGDTVTTRISSKLYPGGIMVGVVDKIEQPEGSNYLDLRIKLSVDFSSITTVYVVNNIMRREQEILETATIKEQVK